MHRITLILLGVLTASSALQIRFSCALAQEMSYTLLTVFTNPTPASGDYFGYSVAAMGTDRVLIGAYRDDTGATDAGAAYLFTTNGVLLNTFTNPAPETNDYFGISVAAIGTDRVLIGAHWDDLGAVNAGAAYLFSTDGTLLTTFTNPTPAALDYFGSFVAAFGTDRVLIGAYGDNAGASDAGVMYSFSTDGTLLHTFTNPTPAASDEFGHSAAVVGTDRVLIGSTYDDARLVDSGTAYLFGASGALLVTFTNPAPTALDYFGQRVAAVGTDRVLIGAWGDDKGASAAGVVYLFHTNGALLTTFTNPAPAADDYFGSSFAVVSSDRILIGAYADDTAATDAGAAYLFTTNGTLLTTLTNAAPAIGEWFGRSIAVLESGQALIGAHRNDTGATDSGMAYLFSLTERASEAPMLNIRPTTSSAVAVSWPSPSSGWILQENTNSVASGNWSNAPGPFQDDGTNKTLIAEPASGNHFYRLFRP